MATRVSRSTGFGARPRFGFAAAVRGWTSKAFGLALTGLGLSDLGPTDLGPTDLALTGFGAPDLALTGLGPTDLALTGLGLSDLALAGFGSPAAARVSPRRVFGFAPRREDGFSFDIGALYPGSGRRQPARRFGSGFR